MFSRKIRDGPGGFGNPRTWELVHQRVWRAAHGAVPAGHAVVFKDGDKRNTKLGNLELVTRAELMRRNSIHTRRSPAEKEAIYALIAVKRMITMKETGRGKKQVKRSA